MSELKINRSLNKGELYKVGKKLEDTNKVLSSQVTSLEVANKQLVNLKSHYEDQFALLNEELMLKDKLVSLYNEIKDYVNSKRPIRWYEVWKMYDIIKKIIEVLERELNDE